MYCVPRMLWEKIGQGRESTVATLKQNTKLLQDLQKAVLAKFGLAKVEQAPLKTAKK